MSRIGKLPVAIPDGVTVALQNDVLSAQGPKGEAELRIGPVVAVSVDTAAKQVAVTPAGKPVGTDQVRHQRAMWGTTRQLIANMILGVTEGYTKALQVVGVGYGAAVQGSVLSLRCGFAHEVNVSIPDRVTVDPPATENLMITGIGAVPCTTITLHSVDKHAVGQFAAAIRAIRPPEPYKGKGIRYLGEEVKRKAGKALATGAT